MQEIPYWRLASIYFFFFAVVGSTMPFWSLYLQSLGYSAHDIGFLASIPMITKVLAPNIWGWIADKSGRLVEVMRLGALGACVCFVGLLFRTDYGSLVFLVAAYSLFWNAILPQFEVVTLRYLKDQPFTYSRIRLWGSIGFIVLVLALGVFFDIYSIKLLPVVIFGFLLAILASACSLPLQPKQTHGEHVGFWQVVRQKPVVLFFLVCFLLQFSHGVYYVFFSIYLESLGYSKTWIGLLWTLGVIAEIVVFAKMPRIMHRFNLYQLAMMSLLLTSVRWLGLAWLADVLGLLLILQCLHAFSFGIMHAVAIEYVRKTFGDACQSQGQALYSAFSFGGGAALGGYLSGLVWEFSPLNAFLMMFVAAFLALLLTHFFLRYHLLYIAENKK